MKHTIPFYLIFFCIICVSCKKKELPAPDPKSPKSVTQTAPVLIAPCESSLINNYISSSYPLMGYYNMYISPDVYDAFDYKEITCTHYSSSNQIDIKLPLKPDAYLGKIKYTIANYSYPSGNTALISHIFLIRRIIMVLKEIYMQNILKQISS